MSSWTKSVVGTCDACGTPWRDHRGPTALCAEIQKLWAKIERLNAELEDSAREESAALTQVEKFSVENGRLTDENKRFADARKAALSLYTAELAGISREEIVKSALEKWPWLGPPEPVKPAPKYCAVITHSFGSVANHREVLCGHPLPCPHHPAAEPKMCPHEAATQRSQNQEINHEMG